MLNTTESIDEKLISTRLLSSASTYLVKLHVPHDADIDHLTGYWGGRGRRKDLRPMLGSLAALPNGGTLDIGDLVFFALKNGDIIHSCVYLAADLVFTKNGDSVFQPWSIMELDDVKQIYSYLSPDGVEVQYWRTRSHED